MAGYEPADAMQYISTILREDVTLKAMWTDNIVKLYQSVAPREPQPFYIVFHMPSEHDTVANGGYRAFTNITFHIEACGREIGYDILRPIMDRVDYLLCEQSAQINNTYVYRFVRRNVMSHADEYAGVRWFFLAGTYETVAFTV